MTEVLETLQKFGPFTAPLCAGMAYAIWWLTGQLRKERDENKGLLRELAEVQKQQALDYAEYGEGVRTVMRDFNVKADAVLLRATGG